MINEFTKALCSNNRRNARIPEEHDYFGALVGEWAIEWMDHLDAGSPRCVKGEWIFARVLDGTAVQDVFIVPARSERDPQPDAEYGTTLRIYNPQSESWDIFYGCTGTAIQLTGKKMGNEIVLVECRDGKMRYIFSDIRPTSFKWRKECMGDAGEWVVVARIVAERT
jgi:hypothetical protein